jgi:hypothetical protein
MLIGVGGFARAGKDAAAAILQAEHGFRRTFMAAPLERALLALDPHVSISAAEAHRLTESTGVLVMPGCPRYAALHAAVGYEASKEVRDVRGLLQRLGGDVIPYLCGRRMFADMAGRAVERLAAGEHDVVITGIRFRNELEMIHEHAGVAWWIEREGTFAAYGHPGGHTVGRGDFDLVISNNGTLADLGAAVAEGVARSRALGVRL